MWDPLFDITQCSLPSIPAVDFQFISNCEILPAPLPIFDCPDIEIPFDVPPPPITIDIPCPVVNTTATIVQTGTVPIVSFTADVTDTGGGGCEINLDLDITIPEPTAGSEGSESSESATGDDLTCETWVWCVSCETDTESWVKLDGTGWVPGDPPEPTWDGRMIGEGAFTCECPECLPSESSVVSESSESLSSSSEGRIYIGCAVDHTCETFGFSPTITLSITASTCATLLTQDITLTYGATELGGELTEWSGNCVCAEGVRLMRLEIQCTEGNTFRALLSSGGTLLHDFTTIACGATFTASATGISLVGSPTTPCGCSPSETIDATLSG